jgi:hypothetical protein
MGFEKSADFGNGIYMNDVEVNHQFDKSSVFLRAASRYISAFISPGLLVTSPLDAMWDLEVSSDAFVSMSAPFIYIDHVVLAGGEDILHGSSPQSLPRRVHFVQ